MAADREPLNGLALSGAADLADTVGEHPADPAAEALALDRLAGAHVMPFYRDQAVIDAARLAGCTHASTQALGDDRERRTTPGAAGRCAGAVHDGR